MPRYTLLNFDVVNERGEKVLCTEVQLLCEWLYNEWRWHGEGEILPGPLLPSGKYRLAFPENSPYDDLHGKGRLSLNVNISKYDEGQEEFYILGDGHIYPTPNAS